MPHITNIEEQAMRVKKVKINKNISPDRKKKTKNKVIRFTVSLQESLLEKLDYHLEQKGYSSRSEFIRDLIREQMVEEVWSTEDTQVTGVLTIVYDLHQRELSKKIIELQECTRAFIICTTQVNIDHNNALNTIIIRGRPKQVEDIAHQISGIKGIKFAKLTKTSKYED